MAKTAWERIVGEEAEVITFRKPQQESVEFDITPMIDVTFLLLIFFLVTSAMEAGRALELPKARFGKGVNTTNALIVTVTYEGEGRPPAVYLADGKIGDPLPEIPEEQRTRIREAVRASILNGKPNVLLKAERKVKHKDIARIMETVAEVGEVNVYVAVYERD